MLPPTPSATARADLSPLFVATALALLLGIQPLTTDLYLPALPALTRELQAPMAAVQLTMSGLILAFGLAQLVLGPVSDRFGRRPVLRAGLVVYTLCALGSAAVPSIELLVLLRVLQGIAMAACVVCARAMVRDLYAPHEGTRVMARALGGLGVIAILGPVAGGLALAAGGWRLPLGLVGLVSLAMAVALWHRLPETAPHRDPDAMRPGPLLRRWREVLSHPTFIACTALSSATYGGLFVVLGGSAFIYMRELGLSAPAYGLVMASGSTAYLLGTFACRRWLSRHGVPGAVARGAVATLAGGLLMLGGALGGAVETLGVWALLLPQWLYAFGHGVHQPCGQAGAVGPFPQAAGTASAMSGFVLAAVAFLVGLGLGVLLEGPGPKLVGYAAAVATGALATTLVAWTLVQRHGVAQPRPA
jgi:DHA1 family bicyclomycin/chloramphenicol resistance-like MFS transporter